MQKKKPGPRPFVPKPGPHSAVRNWHNGSDIEIHFYARSLQNAAKTLVEKLDLDQNVRTDWDACPVFLLYREALELHLKALVGEGSSFLETRTDPISLSRTHSLRWLAQIVCQIIRVVKWESDFKCDGVANLADFSALVNEVESFDPVTRAIRSARAKGPNSVSQYYRTFNVVQFAKRMDALFDLLDVTADALAATWDQQAKEMTAEANFDTGDDFEPTFNNVLL
jgi:hypothetical protein